MIIHVENPSVEIHDLTVTYNKRPVLWAIDLTIPKGCLAGIIGPNGAGKSTLIKSAMGLITPVSGYVKINGKNLDDIRESVSYVPQRESVDWDFPVSVLDVVLMGRYSKLGLFKRPRKADKDVAMDCLKKVGLENFYTRQISQLSGGQQQRVFLARALAQDAEVYFMDEPFAGVDAATEASIIAILREMTSAGKTVIVVHHDLQSAQDYFNWILLLNMRLVASGPTQKVFNQELLQQTYGGKLTLLAKIGDLLEKNQFPARE
ncbi:MAG: metal ABC transporter ATP-binding protein [Cytophagaceae bacterium]